MIAAIRNILKRNLSPESFHQVSSWWWCGKYYLPHRAVSKLVRRPPLVHGSPSELRMALESINTFAPTSMCRIMTKHGSDKGNSWHNYTTVYSALFGPLRGRVRRIFELGLGRDHPQLAADIGTDGVAGASLRGWREIFPHADVYGADIDRSVLFKEGRIATFYCDQLDKQAIQDMWSQSELQQPMDIIIEDGLHTYEGNISFFVNSIDHVRKEGYYVIEDITQTDLAHWYSNLDKLEQQYTNCAFALLQLPSAFNSYDNNMLVAQKTSDRPL